MLMDKYPNALKCRDKYGHLPVHLECMNRCLVDVIRRCIERYPESLAVVDEEILIIASNSVECIFTDYRVDDDREVSSCIGMSEWFWSTSTSS
jgi:hypothetical protein